MARYVIVGATPAPTATPTLYGPNGHPLTPNAPAAPAPNPVQPANTPRATAPRAKAAPGTVGGYAGSTVPRLVGAGAVPGYNPHRPTGVANGAPTGTRYMAWAHMVQVANAGGTLAQWAAMGPHCKPKYLARWVAAGLLAL